MILRNANSAGNTFKNSASGQEAPESSPSSEHEKLSKAELNEGIYMDLHESFLPGVDSQADERDVAKNSETPQQSDPDFY